jgi:acyl-CoA synthetase (NDP forming)
LGIAGIEVAQTVYCDTAEAALAAAADMGWPVALKAVGPSIVHKTEVGGVRLGIRDAAALRAAYQDFSTRLGKDLTGVVVQEMIEGGVEMMAGALQDPTFGPLVVCGSGGVLVDLLGDVAFRLVPVTAADASDMLSGLRAGTLLRGFRGAAPVDEAALREALLHLSALVEACPEIQELDLNPLKVLPRGVRAVDTRVRVGRRPPVASRRIAY